MLLQKNNKLYKFKEHFDKYTSENATNWKLILFWIIMVELFASIFEYLFIGSPLINNAVPNNFVTNLLVGVFITGYLWACVHNFIFWNKQLFLYLVLFGTLGLYIFITNDYYFDFLIANINPLHLADIEVGFVLVIELFFKLLLTYLLYQLVISYKKNRFK